MNFITALSLCYIFMLFLVPGVNFYEVIVLQSVRTVGLCVCVFVRAAMIPFQDGLTPARLGGHADLCCQNLHHACGRGLSLHLNTV